MKNLRVLLSAVAFMLAAGAAIASQVKSEDVMEGFEYIDGASPVCWSIVTTCNTTSPNLCTVNGHVVGIKDEISTSCGTQLRQP